MNYTSPVEQTIRIKNHLISFTLRPGTSDQFICFLHGYPTSSLDFRHLLAAIPKIYNVVLHDHLGFGKSEKPRNHPYLLTDQADIALALYKELGIIKMHLVAHDYGTSVATEIIARDNQAENEIEILSVTLCNGSMLIDMAKLRIIQRFLKNKYWGPITARISNSSTFHRNMKNIWFDTQLYDKKEMQQHWELLLLNNGKRVLPIITRYIDQRYQNYDRWIGAIKKSNLKFHILWAENDPIAIKEMAFQLDLLITHSKLTIIPECGHYPMIEKGNKWINEVVYFIESR